MAKHSIDNRGSEGSSPSPSTKKMGQLQFYVYVLNAIPPKLQPYRSEIYEQLVGSSSSDPCSNDDVREFIDRMKLLTILDD